MIGGSKDFRRINLKIPEKKIVAILGPSGTGKTTLLHLIGGLVRPKSGQMRVLDNSIVGLSDVSQYKLRSRMGMLFQSGALFRIFQFMRMLLSSKTKQAYS